ncbi:MAG: hypothetical protein L6R28_04980 [Planctomycetes bacterium]|nr:hypothetical protein [Planctomycetota bacterium]
MQTKIKNSHRFYVAAFFGALVLAAASFGGTAEAYDRGYVNVEFNGGHHHHRGGCDDCGYRNVSQRVLVSDGYYSKVWVPPVYGYRRHGCHVHRYEVSCGYYRDVWHEPVYSYRTVRTWHTCDAHSRRGHDHHDGYGRVGFSNGRFAIGANFRF